MDSMVIATFIVNGIVIRKEVPQELVARAGVLIETSGKKISLQEVMTEAFRDSVENHRPLKVSDLENHLARWAEKIEKKTQALSEA